MCCLLWLQYLDPLRCRQRLRRLTIAEAAAAATLVASVPHAMSIGAIPAGKSLMTERLVRSKVE